MAKLKLNLEDLKRGILTGERRVLAQAITLLESEIEEHKIEAQKLIEEVWPFSGNSIRIGISGPPGVGKSTFIEALGMYLVNLNKKVAVLAIDPSSQISGGSILGDKTRMQELSQNPNAYIRPTPSRTYLGGVARQTHQSILLCEVSGFEVVLVETVGVGQSESEVHSMVDCLIMLVQPGSGDELQGIKKGVFEFADIFVVNKGDKGNLDIANKALHELTLALSYTRSQKNFSNAFVCSSLEKTGFEEIWKGVEAYIGFSKTNNTWETRRQSQLLKWMWQEIYENLKKEFNASPLVQSKRAMLEVDVLKGRKSPLKAGEELIKAFLNK